MGHSAVTIKSCNMPIAQIIFHNGTSKANMQINLISKHKLDLFNLPYNT